MNIKKYSSGLALMAMAATVSAQTAIGFEDDSRYAAIGVYDSWADSPFRTGELKGNVKVIANELDQNNEMTGTPSNATAKMLAFQRSRLGSNLFGARIDLKTPIKLSPTTQYVHVLIYKEKEGRVMLTGLGKRPERADQKETEQFNVLSTNTVKAGNWYDAVFAIKGAEGVDVNALVVVPDCESTHDLDADFAAYIDEIEVSGSSAARISYESYPVNFDKAEPMTRTDRYTSSISLRSPADGAQSISVDQKTRQLTYLEFLDKSFSAKAGETVTPSVGYSGTWMHTYVYVDLNRDGRFSSELNGDYSIPEGSELLSFSYYQDVNSLGAKADKGSSVQPPAFTIPAGTPDGFYRMRYKVDWNNVDPGGNTEQSVSGNGGIIADTRLNVHGDVVTISRGNGDGAGLNGAILNGDGSNLETAKIPFGQPYVIKAQPANGFRLSHIVIRHGHNLDGDSLVYDTPQYTDVSIPSYLFRDGTYTIPADYIDGDVRITPYFSSDSGPAGGEGDYATNFDKETLTIGRDDRQLVNFQMKATNGGTSGIAIDGNSKKVYRDMTGKEVSVVPGDVVTTTIRYNGNAMHAYLYIDLNQDGAFTPVLNADGTPGLSGELVSYSYYNGKNSLGESLTSPNKLTAAPAFTVPELLPVGVYRARLKVDWNNVDPGGQYSSEGGNNQINDNGGYVVDFLLNVHGTEQNLTVKTRNGSVNGTGNTGLPPTIRPFVARTFVPTPAADGFVADSITIRHGLNFDGPQYIRGNRQWSVYKVPFTSSLNIPKDSINGDLSISVDFKQQDDSGYKLVFAEEFEGPDGSQPDAGIWERADRYDVTWKRFISINDEEHKLTGYVEDGNFVAHCLPNPFKDTDNVDMISGAIRSRHKFAFTYGKIEGRLRTNPYSGNFPAFWMLPDSDKQWPYGGEIDIWEQIDSENRTYHTVHTQWTKYEGGANNPRNSTTASNVQNGYWHTFGFEWTEDLLTWYVDGKKVFSYARSASQDALNRGQWPFDADFYIILNQSVGDGSWAARADVGHTYTTLFDWVRVYQKESDIPSGIGGMENSGNVVDVTTAPSAIHIAAPTNTKVTVTDTTGRLIFAQNVQGNKKITVQRGVYIVNGQKVLVP